MSLLVSASAPALAEDTDFQAGLQMWETYKAGQAPACESSLDSYEILQQDKTDYSVLILHGFSLHPRSMDHYSQLFSGLGMNVIAPRLARHFTMNDRDLDNVSYREWVKDAEAAYQVAARLGRKVIVVGFSLGGLLGAGLALKHPEIDSLYLFSPALRMASDPSRGCVLGSILDLLQVTLPGLNGNSLNDLTGRPIGCGYPYQSGVGCRQIEALMGYNESQNRGSYPALDMTAYRRLKMPLFMGVVNKDAGVETEALASVMRYSQSRLRGYVYFAEGSHGMWTQAATLELVPKVGYEYAQGETLSQQIIKFFHDSHNPDI